MIICLWHSSLLYIKYIIIMKRGILLGVYLCLSVGLAFSNTVSQEYDIQVVVQDYIPTTTWPYLFENFQDAIIYTESGKSQQQVKANLHLEYCTLQYLEGDKIIQVEPHDILKVVMNGETFIYMNGELVQLIGVEAGNAIVKRVKVNVSSLIVSSGSGAYGMGTDVSASKKVRSLQISGITNMTYSQMKVEQNEGKELSLDIEFFFLLNDGKEIIKATKREVEKSLGDNGKTKLKAFLKQNKIKWKEEASLIKLLEFFYQ